ncbi:MAG: hypothetical protein WBD03_00480 [Thermoplasmata archaeon]
MLGHDTNVVSDLKALRPRVDVTNSNGAALRQEQAEGGFDELTLAGTVWTQQAFGSAWDGCCKTVKSSDLPEPHGYILSYQTIGAIFCVPIFMCY